MLQQLQLDEFLELAKTAKRVAVHREIMADRLTPIGIVESLADEMHDGAILESGMCHQDAGRYSFIAFDAMAQLRVQNTAAEATPPFTALRQLLVDLACAGKPQVMDLINAAVGFITYDAIRFFEEIPDRHPGDHPLPAMLFNFYQNTLVFDHLQQRLLISMIVPIDHDPAQIYHNTQEKISALAVKITTPLQRKVTPVTAKQNQDTPVNVDTSDEQYKQLVERAKQYIVAGDAFQIVLSRCLKNLTAKPFDIYRVLRNPTHHHICFISIVENYVILGASPEKLISVADRECDG